MYKPLLILMLVVLTHTTFSQNLTDGLMMRKKTFCTGLMYTHDQWKDYWEGELKRDNGNVGKVTTQNLMWVGTYGLLDKVNIIAMVPYVKTEASQGTMQGMKGMQDLSLGVKYNFFGKKFAKSAFHTFGVINFSTPISDYTPDFYPFSIGAHTTNIQYRLSSYFKMESGLFVNASAGYTWRSNTTLDRPAYHDGNNLYLTDEVKMPNVFDVFVSMGYNKGPLQAELQYMQMNTLGGGDIRRQDMPFVSNRMNFIKTGVLVMYYLPMVKNLAVRGAATFTVDGCNVGQSTTIMTGLLYTFYFTKEEQPQ